MLRKILFWTHLIAGCTGGLVILMMSFTGVLLTYERQILASVERGPFRISPAPATARLPVEELLQAVNRNNGGLPKDATVILRSDLREPAEISVGREGSLYVNPYTGAVLGRPTTAWRTFFRKVTAWHRWFAFEGEGRLVAKAITGACNLAFLGIVLSGIYLWLPKKWTRQHLGPITWFRTGLSAKAREFNWHNVFGIWTAVPLVVVVATALPMSYMWANNLLFRITGNQPAAQGPPGGRGPGGPGGPGGRQRPAVGAEAPELQVAGLNPLWQRAENQTPGWQSISMRVPDSPRRPVAFTIDTGDGGQPQKRATLTLDRTTGDVVRLETFASNNAGRRLRMWSRFLHTGEALGFVGQTLAGIASLAGVFLVYTGIALSLRRFAAWRRRRRASRQPEMANA